MAERTIKIQDYKYNGITPNQEDDVIGYALIKQGYVYESGEIEESKVVEISLNSEPLKDIAAIRGYSEEMIISPIHFSKYGNYLGDEKFFTPNSNTEE